MIGLPGQVDYTAANAYLDTFAVKTAARDGRTRAVAVNWNAWQDVGMAVEAAGAAIERDRVPFSDAGSSPSTCSKSVDDEGDEVLGAAG